MYPFGWEQILIIVLLFWTSTLTLLFLLEKEHYKKLFPKEGGRDFRNKFKELVEIIEAVEGRAVNLEKNLRGFKKESLANIQRFSILRYNHYNDTGGDQSFSLVLLDGKLNGFLLTSLHSRSGTRVYTKIIDGGKSDLELSKEEQEVLGKALG